MTESLFHEQQCGFAHLGGFPSNGFYANHNASLTAVLFNWITTQAQTGIENSEGSVLGKKLLSIAGKDVDCEN